MKLRTILPIFCTLFMTACVQQDLNLFEDNRTPESEYFDFKTKTDVNLTIDYGFEGYKVPFAVFTSDPLDEFGLLIEGKSPIYAAFTDENSSFIGKINVPSHVKTLYLYSDAHAIPNMLELDVQNGNAEYIYQYVSDDNTRSLSHTGECYSIGDKRDVVSSSYNLYSLFNTYARSSGSNTIQYRPSNTYNSNLFKTLSNNEKLSSQSTLGQLITRITSTLRDGVDNSFYCSDSKHTNLRIANITEDGEQVEAAHIDLVLISSQGGYHNAMGYYYYKSDAVPTAAEIKALPKFMVFPRTTTNKPNSPIKARLQFFGENYNENGVDHFPPGYTIGWMLVADIAGYENDKYPSTSTTADYNTIKNRISLAYSKNRGVYSDKEANQYGNYGCITLSDKLSEKVIIGFEDQAYKSGCGDKSYNDILFYVDCDPIEAIFDPERPEISDKPEEQEVTRTQTQYSTLAFEDIWPYGGDYDMNDVVVELSNAITFNQNNRIKRIETKVKATHNGAKIPNAFGYVINGVVGDVVAEESTFFTREESNQFIFFADTDTALGETFTLVRTFGDEGIDKLTYDDTYNPFVVADYKPGEKNRTEVHLPKHQPTSWINQNLIGEGNDMYFVDVDGLYPFAIELFDVKDWEVVTEMKPIGSEGEYPYFINWVESKGETNTDWYLKKK